MARCRLHGPGRLRRQQPVERAVDLLAPRREVAGDAAQSRSSSSSSSARSGSGSNGAVFHSPGRLLQHDLDRLLDLRRASRRRTARAPCPPGRARTGARGRGPRPRARRRSPRGGPSPPRSSSPSLDAPVTIPPPGRRRAALRSASRPAFADDGAELPFVEPDADALARPHLRGRQDRRRRALAKRDRVAAREHGERAQELERAARAPGGRARRRSSRRAGALAERATCRFATRSRVRASSATRGKSSSTRRAAATRARVLRGPPREQRRRARRGSATIRSRPLPEPPRKPEEPRRTARQPAEVAPARGRAGSAWRAGPRAARCATRRSISSLRSTTSSAAAEGVGARRSATRSRSSRRSRGRRRRSSGCARPRARGPRRSSLNGARSSGEPPPRARIEDVEAAAAVQVRGCAATISSGRAALPGRAPGRS